MTFGGFINRSDSIHDDSPPLDHSSQKFYFARASATVGDWIVYYVSVKVQRLNEYYAIARVAEIVPDPTANDMFNALI